MNSVLVEAVVRDSQGHAVGDLKREDFQVFDQNKLQEISGFSIQKRALVENNPAPKEAAPIRPAGSQPPDPGRKPDRFLVFLFDDFHLDAAELVRAQQSATKMLAQSLTPSDIAAVVSFSGTNSGLTRDQAALREAIQKLHLQGIHRHIGRACPDIDFYQADLIVNKNNDQALSAGVREELSCAHLDPQRDSYIAERLVRSAAAQSLSIGEADIRATLATLREIVRRMAALPGQRTLMLISPGFLTITQEGMMEKSQILDLAAQSNVTINALDARGLYTTGITASQLGTSSSRDLQTGASFQYHSDTMNLNEDVMAELADGTGGTFFHNNNDLEHGFQILMQAPEYVYLLEFSLGQEKPDGRYHPLKVKVEKDGLKVQARRGYFAPGGQP